jgi:MFS family permease
MAGPGATLPAALAEPQTRVGWRWVALLVLATIGVWMAFLTPIQVLLAQQVKAIDPAHKETMLGWVTAYGALAAMIVNPVAGALSDRTTLRTGRRHIWTLAGALVAAGALVLLADQHTIIGVAIGWVAAQLCLNVMLANLTAAVPDRVPVHQRGTVSGWVGMPQVLGLVLGVVLVTAVVNGIFAGYAVMALALVLLALPFVLLTPDDPLPRTHRPMLTVRAILSGLWIDPRRHPDFGWAWITRFLVQLGNAIGTLYLLYFLQDAVRIPDAEGALLTLILVYSGALVATTVVSGRMSDKSGRRKVYVIWSGMVMAAAALVLAIWPVWWAAVVGAALLGAGYGVYVSVDAALITQVLPAATDRAKDLGVINIANSAPQVLAPAMSAPIVVSLGGYPVLYGVTAVVTVVGSLLVLKIKSVP